MTLRDPGNGRWIAKVGMDRYSSQDAHPPSLVSFACLCVIVYGGSNKNTLDHGGTDDRFLQKRKSFRQKEPRND